uniref:EF-hand domain-containing protein n=1 Tax=Haptolina ericina TaxID=156174 RepID=A0A7S3AF27_9EUKA
MTRKGAAGPPVIKLKRGDGKSVQDQLRQALGSNVQTVMEAFRLWDLSGEGLISKKEFQVAMFAMGFDNVSNIEWRELFDSFDKDRSGSIDFDELLVSLA